MTNEEIEAAKSPKGGWSAKTLASWGVPWPPPKGWRKRLIAQSRPIEEAGMWITAEGRRIPIQNMTDPHLHAAIEKLSDWVEKSTTLGHEKREQLEARLECLKAESERRLEYDWGKHVSAELGCDEERKE